MSLFVLLLLFFAYVDVLPVCVVGYFRCCYCCRGCCWCVFRLLGKYLFYCVLRAFVSARSSSCFFFLFLVPRLSSSSCCSVAFSFLLFLGSLGLVLIWCAGTTPILEKTLRECRGKWKSFGWVRGNSGNRSESCSENCGFRIDQVVRGHSENGISYSENGISNSESCSENTPELSESSENGPFTPRAFFLKLGWSPGFWVNVIVIWCWLLCLVGGMFWWHVGLDWLLGGLWWTGVLVGPEAALCLQKPGPQTGHLCI